MSLPGGFSPLNPSPENFSPLLGWFQHPLKEELMADESLEESAPLEEQESALERLSQYTEMFQGDNEPLHKAAVKIQAIFRGFIVRQKTVFPSQIIQELKKHLLKEYLEGTDLTDIANGLSREILEALQNTKGKKLLDHGYRLNPLETTYKFPKFKDSQEDVMEEDENPKEVSLPLVVSIHFSADGKSVDVKLASNRVLLGMGKYKVVYAQQAFTIHLDLQPKEEHSLQKMIRARKIDYTPKTLQAFERGPTASRLERMAQNVLTGVKWHDQIQKIVQGNIAAPPSNLIHYPNEPYMSMEQPWYNSDLAIAALTRDVPRSLKGAARYNSQNELIEKPQEEGGAIPFKVEDMVKVLADVAEDLQQMADVGLMHRDVKASNILLHVDETGAFSGHIADFDLAIPVGYTVPNYSKRYQYWDSAVYLGFPSPFTDVFALGMTIAEIIDPEFMRVKDKMDAINTIEKRNAWIQYGCLRAIDRIFADAKGMKLMTRLENMVIKERLKSFVQRLQLDPQLPPELQREQDVWECLQATLETELNQPDLTDEFTDKLLQLENETYLISYAYTTAHKLVLNSQAVMEYIQQNNARLKEALSDILAGDSENPWVIQQRLATYREIQQNTEHLTAGQIAEDLNRILMIYCS